MKLAIVRCGEELQLLLPGKKKILSLEEARGVIAGFDTYKTLSGVIDEYEGDLLISLEADNELVIYDAVFFRKIMNAYEFPYCTPDEYANKHGRDRSRILRLCRENRLEGAWQLGGILWLIPKDTPYPTDGRAGRDMSKRYANKPRN